jgi:hypothetical protein
VKFVAAKPKEKSEPKARKEGKEEKRKAIKPEIYAAAAIVIIAIAIGSALYFMESSSFQSFKSTMDSSHRIAITAEYTNQTSYDAVSLCFTSIIQVLSSTRNPSTIDFFLVNNDSCTYSPTGLGHQINPVTENASTCLSAANSEPGIFLSYGSNSTRITPTHMYISGDSSYYAKCPIAVDLS